MISMYFFRLVGCQTLLEEIPGRKKDNLQLMLSSPGESKSLLRGSKNYSGKTKTYNVKEEVGSKFFFNSTGLKANMGYCHYFLSVVANERLN